MSQSSMSSTKSLESRKRGRPPSPETPRKSRRKRSALTLKRKYFEVSSQSSCDSISRCDTQSTDSFIETGASLEISNSSNSEYASLARLYSISIATAKKYHSILTSTPQVPVMRTSSIKQEPISPNRILVASPVFGSTKRGRKPKIKIEPKAVEKDLPETSLSERANRNIQNYFETLCHPNIKKEPNDSVEECEQLQLLQDCSQQVQNQDLRQNNNQLLSRSKSFPSINRQRHLQNSSKSKSKTQQLSNSYSDAPKNLEFKQSNSQPLHQNKRSFPQEKCQQSNSTISKELFPNFSDRWKGLIDSSGDESVDAKSLSQIANKKNRTIVANPFSSIKNKSKSSQNLKTKKKSFWRKKFGNDDDPIKRKKKFLRTFMIHEKDDSLESRLKIENHDSEEESGTPELYRFNSSKIKTKQTKRSCNNDELASVDSLSVNCQYFNQSTVEAATSIASQLCPSSLLLSFGADPSNCEQNVPTNGNTYNSKVNSSEAGPEVLSNADDLEEKENDLNGSFLSLDLAESPTKTTEKSRAKPKIISDSKLPNNTIKLRLKVESMITPENVNNKLQSQSEQLQFEKSNGTECTLNGDSKCLNLDNDAIQTPQTNGLKNNNGVEESFDSLCQDITELSNNEQTGSITLYKADDVDDVNDEVLSNSRVNNSKNQRPKTPKLELLNREVEEKSALNSNRSSSTKSPITFQNNRLLSLRSPSVIKIQENTVVNNTTKKSLLSLKIPKTSNSSSTSNSRLSLSLKSPKLSTDRNKTPSPSLSNSNTRISPITFQSTSQFSSHLKSPTSRQDNINSTKVNNILEQDLPQSSNVLTKIQHQQETVQSINSFSNTSINKDPRLNRSLSPVKAVSVPSRDPRLNRSNSPIKFPVSNDPRLVRSTSKISSPTSEDLLDKSPDPRLRKRKEREEIQKRQEIKCEQENDSMTNNGNSKITLQQTPKKASVFDRLGIKKSPSPTKSVDLTRGFMLDLLKDSKKMKDKSRPLGSIDYDDTDDDDDDDDDDGMSIHPDKMFSSDEESNASPPHRKFTSERMRVNEEIRNMPISVKDRLTWNNRYTNQRNSTSCHTTATSTVDSMATTTKSNRVINRITFDTNTSNQSKPLKAPELTGMAAYATQSNKISFNSYGNNDPAFNEQFYKNNTAALNDKFYMMNTAQMLKDVDNLRQFGSTPNVTFGNDNVQEQNERNASKAKSSFFKAFCYRTLRSGNCHQEMINCTFSHNLYPLQKLITMKKIDLLIPILDVAISYKFGFFLQNVWKSILPTLNLEAFNVYNKLYQAELRSERFLNELLDYCLNAKLHSVESFVKRLVIFVNQGNKDWVRVICVAIKAKMADGFCWETIKCLSLKAVPPVDMIELTILQCLKRKKNLSHITEVYDLVKNKLNDLERNKMSQTMLKQFYLLVQKLGLVDDKEVLNTVPILNPTNDTENAIRCQSVESLKSAEAENQGSIVNMSPRTRKNRIESPLSVHTSSNVQQPINSPVDVRISTPNKGESTNFDEYRVKEVECSKPTSAFQKRFWKLYLAVNNVDEGLSHEDYDYVWTTLHEFSKQDVANSLLKRAYYHILCRNVTSSEQHLSEIIKRAVHNGRPKSKKCLDLLFQVGICALIDLANNELWVMALQLLGSIKIIEPKEPTTTFVLICTEIYLANNDPLEALYLLQRTRLIKTNRDEWLTKDHTKGHEHHRNKIIIILLRALSYADPDKAVYLFKTLLMDQYIDYYPVDLRLYLDNLILLLLLHDQEELVADVCRLIINYDLSFQKATYRELITRMLPVDEILTNQLLDYAINLGYYNDIQIKNGFTTVIIDTNCTEEELYLMLRRLIHVLVINIGPVIHRLKPNQLKVILIFEDIPVDKRLYRNELCNRRRDAYIDIRNQVNKMLATRFTPPIRISRGKISKVCKIMSRTLVDYLKHWN